MDNIEFNIRDSAQISTSASSFDIASMKYIWISNKQYFDTIYFSKSQIQFNVLNYYEYEHFLDQSSQQQNQLIINFSQSPCIIDNPAIQQINFYFIPNLFARTRLLFDKSLTTLQERFEKEEEEPQVALPPHHPYLHSWDGLLMRFSFQNNWLWQIHSKSIQSSNCIFWMEECLPTILSLLQQYQLTNILVYHNFNITDIQQSVILNKLPMSPSLYKHRKYYIEIFYKHHKSYYRQHQLSKL